MLNEKEIIKSKVTETRMLRCGMLRDVNSLDEIRGTNTHITSSLGVSNIARKTRKNRWK